MQLRHMRCDRCGGEEGPLPGRHCGWESVLRRWLDMLPEEFGGEYDLCPPCVKQLERFLEGAPITVT